MKTLLAAGALLGTTLLAGSVRADEPNAEAARAIREIAARRVAKEEARVKQVETWAQGEGREGGLKRAGVFNPAPGAPINIQVK